MFWILNCHKHKLVLKFFGIESLLTYFLVSHFACKIFKSKLDFQCTFFLCYLWMMMASYVFLNAPKRGLCGCLFDDMDNVSVFSLKSYFPCINCSYIYCQNRLAGFSKQNTSLKSTYIFKVI